MSFIEFKISLPKLSSISKNTLVSYSMKILENHVVPVLTSPIRLSDYAIGIFNALPTKASIKKALKKGLILVDKKRGLSGLYITGTETIELLEDQSLAKKKHQPYVGSFVGG